MIRSFTAVGVLVAGALVVGACSGDDERGTGLATEPSPGASRGTDIAVVGTDRVRFEPDTVTVPVGREVTLTLSAEPGLEHDFVVEDAGGAAGGDLHVVHADAGQTADASFRIDEPGTYMAYCSVPGHRRQGMLATLVVEDTG